MTESSQNILTVPQAIWRETTKRARVIAELAEEERCSVTQIDNGGERLHLGRAMVYRLVARFIQNQDTSALLPARAGRKAGRHMLNKAQERIISDLIKQLYLTKQNAPSLHYIGQLLSNLAVRGNRSARAAIFHFY